MDLVRKYQNADREGNASQRGFTLMEAAIALVVLMVMGLGVASLFTYAVQAYMKADVRELDMATPHRLMEWLRIIPITTQTRSVAFSLPNGGLGATATAVVNETVTNSG